MSSPPQRPKQQMNPQQMHSKLDLYEQHLQGEMKKIKAVRTLHPPPMLPGAPKKSR